MIMDLALEIKFLNDLDIICISLFRSFNLEI